jgi:hypothetical protein
MVMGLLTLSHTPSRSTPYKMSADSYSTYSQLFFISGVVSSMLNEADIKAPSTQRTIGCVGPKATVVEKRKPIFLSEIYVIQFNSILCFHVLTQQLQEPITE